MFENLQLQAASLEKKDPKWLENYLIGQFDAGGKTLNYRIHIPAQAQNKDADLPLMIWLHGVKGRGRDNSKQLLAGNSHGPQFLSSEALQSDFPMIVLVPQCPNGKFWVNFRRCSTRKPFARVMDLLQTLKKELPINSSQIYIGGQSMGGFATWAAMIEFPKVFAAGIAVSGGGSPRKAKRKIKAPVWAFHGTNDPVVGVGRSKEMVEALSKAEKPVKFTEFPSGRHDIWPLVFAEDGLVAWLKSQKLAKPEKKSSSKSGGSKFGLFGF